MTHWRGERYRVRLGSGRLGSPFTLSAPGVAARHPLGSVVLVTADDGDGTDDYVVVGVAGPDKVFVRPDVWYWRFLAKLRRMVG
jgi:hypothetical protein